MLSGRRELHFRTQIENLGLGTHFKLSFENGALRLRSPELL